jgi:hypothetical protein
MIELLVCLGILAFTLGGILSIFFAGKRFGDRAQERSEAGRVAQAVFDFADAPKDGALIQWGRVKGDPVVRNNPPELDTHHPAAAGMFDSPLALVCTATIDDYVSTDLPGMHVLIVEVYRDDDLDGYVNTLNDTLIGRYYSLLADR